MRREAPVAKVDSMLESDGKLQIEQNSVPKAVGRTPCTRNQAACLSGLSFAVFVVAKLCCQMCMSALKLVCSSYSVSPIQALKLLGVKAKWFLILECILIFLAMTPLVHLAYNHIAFNEVIRSISWGK